MIHSLTHYLSAFVFLLASSVVYQNALSPFMQPPEVESIALKQSAVRRGDDSLADLFPDGSWQRGTCKQLQTSQGVLLFENWEQTDEAHWRLWPITVVIGRGLSATKASEPVIIEAAEGAELKFTESLDVMSGGAPPIDWGRMVGDVHIFRADPDQEGKRSLDLRTANVGIDSHKIWTTEAINMSVGEARMVGRDLTIHLAGAASPGGSSPAVLDRMELIYLDELMMPLRGGGLFDSANDSGPDSDQPGMISVACGGRVEYDFAIDQLLLRESVSLIYQTAGQLADRFDCQQLELTLNDPTNDSIVRRTPLDWLVKMVAFGSPASAKLPSIDSEISADEITLNATVGLLEASGQRGIRVRRGAIKASLANLIYQFDPANPEAIGVINADGAGIVTVDDPTNPVREARWRDGFYVRPEGVATAKNLNTDVELRVEGDVRAWLVDGGEFAADSIFGLFTPEPVTPDPNSMAPQPGSPESEPRTTLVPKWFNIKGNVRIMTMAVAAETDEMWLDFVSEEEPSPRSGASDGSLAGNSAAASPLRQWVAQPTSDSPMVDPVARTRPVIRGASINAQLRRNSAGLSAKKLSVVGGVEVTHMLEMGGQSLPAKMTGESLALIDGGGQDVLQLSSSPAKPARFELGDGFFVGPQIQIRPSDNMVWINAAGEFQIPTAALPTGLAGSGPAGDVASGNNDGGFIWTSAPHCRWQGEMLFDGRKAVLTDGVDIKASLVSNREPWDLHFSGDRLEVDLQEGVQMRDMASMRDAVIQKITMLQTDERPVIVQALHSAADGVREAKHLIHARSLTISPGGGGQLVGAGPGWYRGWTIAKSITDDSENDYAAASGLSANATMVDSAAQPLTGIHLTFNDSMQADLASRNLDFLRGVRVGVQAVSGWDQAFDAAQMDSISVGQSTLDCDRLRFSVTPGSGVQAYPGASTFASASGSGTSWEMEAVSGVVFRTRNKKGLLEGTASRASYASFKDLFIVEGAPNRPAIFRQTLADGQPGPEGAVRSMTVRPGTMEFKGEGLERFNPGNPELGGRR
ncbi:hypothetical protein K227x_33200 [Rubripirellula lacrimiformis]|uniref:Organic solvent tolerance-like N-terminal domain-containing protein n=1 Tax=Rubripirellula lacrimiformis TaxID=1930273 RepID=A0A517NCQ3_9BACT|nr:hypothetical protein [Rubripirellula lacrimiformis]QDT04922.1 hypothetical protein K227x_33200 [Rubripirellula lacrimiformis]